MAGSAEPARGDRVRMGDAVYRELLSRMFSLRLEPGARLSVDALVRELGVSQTPIREALSRLEADGAVVRTHLAGYRTAPQLTRAQLDDIVEVRLLLEPFAARRAAERTDRAAVDELRALAAAMAEPEGADPGVAHAVFAGQDARFHDLVAAGGRNAVVRETLARMHTHVRLFRLVTGAHVRTEALDEHGAVLTAIAGGDPEGAARAMRRHVERSAARFAPHAVD